MSEWNVRRGLVEEGTETGAKYSNINVFPRIGKNENLPFSFMFCEVNGPVVWRIVAFLEEE